MTHATQVDTVLPRSRLIKVINFLEINNHHFSIATKEKEQILVPMLGSVTI
jgi:hypothetical protein